MITSIIDDININYELRRLLIYEGMIKYKKKHKIKLTKEEYFFDKYLISPSSLLRIIERRLK